MSFCLVYSGALAYSVLFSVYYDKSKKYALYIGLSFLENICSVSYKTTLVSPLGQGGSDHHFCNYQFVFALFSPPERGLVSAVLNLVFAK